MSFFEWMLLGMGYGVFVTLVWICGMNYSKRKYRTLKKIYLTSNSEWLDINKFPIPEDISNDFFISNGHIVSHCSTFHYDKNGRIIFPFFVEGYHKGSPVITHWMPEPSPPLENKEENNGNI